MQLETLRKALNIRKELDGYHGRVTFDDRNIEDILSMLSFNILGGGSSDKEKLQTFLDAISVTIELSCNVKHPGYPKNSTFKAINEGNEIYRRFWHSLFKFYQDKNTFPTIITFNYDLVLERSLFQTTINTIYGYPSNRVPFESFFIDYNYQYIAPEFFKIKYASYNDLKYENVQGTILEKIPDKDNEKCLSIEILKLHGSLNFPSSPMENISVGSMLTSNISNPYIIPPVSNKSSSGAGDKIWRTALIRLRECKNIVFVGYSLPITDMYMQYFLKAALGPNHDLNKVYIFDPVLWRENESSQLMKQRYKNCFAEQLRQRLIFKPNTSSTKLQNLYGTTNHFVQLLEKSPEELFFC